MEVLHQLSQELLRPDLALDKKSGLRRRPTILYATTATQV